jgi:hypothetical protein
VKWAWLAAAALLVAGCGTKENDAASLDCEQTRSTSIQAPARLGGDPAAITAWYLEKRGLRGTDIVEEAPGADAETAVIVRRDRAVVAKVTVEENDATVVTCADFAR